MPARKTSAKPKADPKAPEVEPEKTEETKLPDGTVRKDNSEAPAPGHKRPVHGKVAEKVELRGGETVLKNRA